MKRAVICVDNPQDFIPQLKSSYSIMVMDPCVSPSRKSYLLEESDWSLMVSNDGEFYRNGADYGEEQILLYTSGTTGDSKFYGFTQQQIEILAKKYESMYELSANDRLASVMPLWHAHGQSFYWAAQHVGCEIKYFSMNRLKYVSDFSPTFTSAVPNILKFLSRFNFHSFRFISVAGTNCTSEMYKQLTEKFNAPLLEAFGMTESMGHCFTNPLNGEIRPGTVGLPVGIDAYIDEQQQLYIAGPTVAKTGWFQTGDLAQQDSRGYYVILGRNDDQINVKGLKLNPLSLERQILDCVPGVSECVIFGRQEVNCVYVGNTTSDHIQKYLLSLGPHCRAKVIVKTDMLPLNSAGKISRKFLQETYGEIK
jgi:acyl-coenzyme A synthetase/AMP-(fatty) acid ligase